MAITTYHFTVTLGDYELDCADLTDEWKQSLVRHRVPGRNGAQLESMGWEEGIFRLKTVFIGSDRMSDYVDLLTILRQGASISVRHPVYGPFDAMVESVSTRYDERINTGEVDFTVIEDGQDWGVTYRPNAADLAITTTQSAIDDGVCVDLDQGGLLRDVGTVDLSDPSWLEKVYDLGLGNKINSYVSRLKTQLGKIDALTAAINSTTSAAFNALKFTDSLPGQIAEKIAALFDALGISVTASSDPVLAVSNLVSTYETVCNGYSGTDVDGSMRVLSAMTAARYAATVMDKDEDNLNAQIAVEESATFDNFGNYIGKTTAAPTMPATPDQVGRMVAIVRGSLDSARAYTGASKPLEDMALALQQQYRTRLTRYETLREITVAEPTPLHIICQRYKLPYNAAERIVRLNQIRNPTFVEGTIRIYAN